MIRLRVYQLVIAIACMVVVFEGCRALFLPPLIHHIDLPIMRHLLSKDFNGKPYSCYEMFDPRGTKPPLVECGRVTQA